MRERDSWLLLILASILMGVIAAFLTAYIIIVFHLRTYPPESHNYNVMQGPPAERREAWFGYQQDTEATKRFLSTLPNPTIRGAGPLLFQGPPSPFGVQDKEPIVLTRALNKAWKARFGTDFVVGRQEIGDCVSWGWGHAADIHLAILWAQGESDFFETNCTEALYGGGRCEALGKDNGGTQDGSYGAAQAKWFIEFGCVWRTKYSFVDTTTYSGSRAKDWGQWGCGGKNDGGKLDAEAKKFPLKNVALVETFEEAVKSIENGYCVAVCSQQGFAVPAGFFRGEAMATRDKDGFLRASGSWPHCMCFCGVRYDRPALLCLNSWGPSWVDGPKYPADQPDGSFWVEAKTVNTMLDDRDSFTVSGHGGFKPRKLDHGGWVNRHSDNETVLATAL